MGCHVATRTSLLSLADVGQDERGGSHMRSLADLRLQWGGFLVPA
jgi:hypothetical protein